MNLPTQILTTILWKKPLGFSLVVEGVKPTGFISLAKLGLKVDKFQRIPIPTRPHIYVYAFPDVFLKNEDIVHVLIFNERAISKKLSLLNKSQTTFKFKNAQQVIKAVVKFHKTLGQRRKWSLRKKRDVTVIMGLCFGFPVVNVLRFGNEVLAGKMEKKRIVHKLTGDLVFIGYPETKLKSLAVLNQWKKFKKTRFKKSLKQISKDIY